MPAALLALLATALPSAEAARPAPACFDLSEPRSALVLSSQDLLLRLTGRELLLRTDGACLGLLESASVLLEPVDGGTRFCGRGDALSTVHARCAIAAMVDLPAAAETCFRSDHMRSWSLVALDRMRVRTRTGSYEIELAGSCPELSFSDGIRFRSLRGLREVCGGRNDQVIPLGAVLSPGSLLSRSASARDVSGPGGPVGAPPAVAAGGFACTIRSVQKSAGRELSHAGSVP